MDLIEKLKILMKRKNIKNISQLSREALVPYTTLKSIFDGDVNDVRLSTSRKLCDFFEITLDDLLDDDIEIADTNDKLINLNDTEDLTPDELADLLKYKEFLKYKREK